MEPTQTQANVTDTDSSAPGPEREPEAPGPVDSEDLSFPITESPNISIIISVFNNWAFTHKCLRSLYLHNRGSYEIIVVDNNSTDETPQLLAAIEGIQVLTNETNEVFVNACNQAADVAKGNYLLFLNNDTEVSEGWLDALLAPFSESSTGIVGAKLVYPDGTLQEAGGIIWSDGNGCNYGHGDNPDLPTYSYRKAVDYCSGACLIISSTLWNEIGGFDQRYAPAYYADTDLCFTVRALNYKVIYQPAARIVHYGGVSAGKETSSDYKRYQDINRLKFIDKWQEVLERDHVLSSAGLFGARERTGDKHILIIDHQVPTFDRDAGSLRMLNMLQLLQSMDYKVSFWPDQLTDDPKYTRVLQDLGIETYCGELRFEDFIRAHGNELDVVLMSRPTTQKYMHLVKEYSKAKTILDTVDLHYVGEQRRLDLEVQRWKNLEFFLTEEEPTKKETKSVTARPVVVHCHLFKNAGSTLDWSLQRQFGSAFIDHRDDDNMRRGAAYLKPYLETHRQVSAISSHHVRFPLPVSDELQLLPLIALRHPIDRARSVYDFERRQEGNTPGAIHAKKLSFADYVRWRMQPDVAPTIRNFHCSFCISNFDTLIGEPAYLESVAMLIKTPLLVIVERYDESMVLLEHDLEKYFPGIDLSYLRQNETFGRQADLVQRIVSVFEQLGPELTAEFREKNHWDMKLYENSLAIQGERLGALGNLDRSMADFQARCRLLSVATLPGNAVEIPEPHVG